jgi:hypothetical protein
MRLAFFAALLMCVAPAAAQFGGSSEQATTTTQTTTTKTQNGDTTTTTTTTRSETTSSGGGITFGNLFGNHAAPGPAPTYETLGGHWKIGETNGSLVCDLTLDKTKFVSSYGARTGIGCPEGLFGVSSWMLFGDEIRLMSPGGSELARLRAGAGGRWTGKTAKGLDIFMARD